MELNNAELEEYNRLNSDVKETKKPESEFLEKNMSWIMITILAALQVIISCLSTVNGEIAFVFPTTVVGWIFLVAPKIVIGVLAYMIWLEFVNNGYMAATNTDEYKKAEEIFKKIQGKTTKNIINVENPDIWLKRQKIRKGFKIFMSSTLTFIAISSLFVAFNVASLIGSLASIAMSVFFGLQMRTEVKRRESFDRLKYAHLLQIQFEQSQNTAQNQTKTDEVSKISSEGDNVDQCVNMEPTEALDEQSRSDIWNNASN